MQGPHKGFDLAARKEGVKSEIPAAELPSAQTEGAAVQRDSNLSVRAGESEELERLRRAVQVLSYTLHGLSHDLREPIRTVRCYSEMLARSGTIQIDANLADYVRTIAGAAERMDALVSGMLDYSRLLAIDAPVFGPVDMNVVVQTALANLQLKIEELGATVAADALPEVYGDYSHLTQVVQNLIGNALKYCGTASPNIFVRAKQLDDEAVFSIEDNGVGIDPRYHSSIFEPFKRLHGNDLPGSGLGLAICRQIIELHHGRIWVESAEGSGSTFYFTLPATRM